MRGQILLLLAASTALPSAGALGLALLDVPAIVPDVARVAVESPPAALSEPEPAAALPAVVAPSPQPIVDPLVEAIPDIPIAGPAERPPPPSRAEGKAARLDRDDATWSRAQAELPIARLARDPASTSLLSSVPDTRAWSTQPRSAAPDPAPRARTPAHDAPAAQPPGPSWHDAGAAAAAGLALALLAPLLYHRMRGRALVSGQRAHLLALIASRPGVTVADAARALALDPSTVVYHLRILRRETLVGVEGRRYFAAGSTASAEERAHIVALRTAGPILEAVRASPGASKSALASQLAIARASVSHHLARLDKAGLVRYERMGRSVRVYPKETLSPQAR